MLYLLAAVLLCLLVVALDRAARFLVGCTEGE
jgi:hypothetical protein